MGKGLKELVEELNKPIAKKSETPLVTKWVDTGENGARLMTMPNIPTPLQGEGMQPRTIFGVSAWNKIRKKCYADAGYHCQICGADCTGSIMHAHEVYSIDYKKHTSTFERVVALCPLCHVKGIHSGRALTLYKKGVPYMSREKLLEGAENAFTIISSYNRAHPGAEPLRAFETFLDYAKQPALKADMEHLIRKYNMEFYHIDERSWRRKYWSDWRIIINGVEYPTVYENIEAWQDAMEINNTNNRIEESKLSFNEEVNKFFDELEKNKH